MYISSALHKYSHPHGVFHIMHYTFIHFHNRFNGEVDLKPITDTLGRNTVCVRHLRAADTHNYTHVCRTRGNLSSWYEANPPTDMFFGKWKKTKENKPKWM